MLENANSNSKLSLIIKYRAGSHIQNGGKRLSSLNLIKSAAPVAILKMEDLKVRLE